MKRATAWRLRFFVVLVAALQAAAGAAVRAQTTVDGHIGILVPWITRAGGQNSTVFDSDSIGMPLGVSIKGQGRMFVDFEFIPAVSQTPHETTLTVDPGVLSGAQGSQTGAQSGKIMSTVTDVNGDGVPGAAIVLSGPDPADRRTAETDQNGFFQFDAVKPGITYRISVSASGFEPWSSADVSVDPGQFKLLDNIQLRIATEHTTVEVRYEPEQVATEQIRLEEKQRILGIIPNFYVSYEGDDTEPLSRRMKFDLALKVSCDPVTIGGVALISGLRQAANSPNYPQGAKGYGERFGATAADGFTDIMIGGAILPSLLRQDPRYFYQGTGSTKSRVRHAMLSPFISRGDNGKWGPNYSSLGGDLASAAIANLYYPKANRGVGLVFGNFAIGTAERVGASLAQEFLLGKLTHRGGHIN